MASELVGRAACPECGNPNAHVKKSEKCLYRHCPECGAQYHATGDARAAKLMEKTRPEKHAPVAPPTPTPRPAAPAPAPEPAPAPTPTPTPVEAPKPKRKGLFG